MGTVYDCASVNELNGIYVPGERERRGGKGGREKESIRHSRDTIPSRTVSDEFPSCSVEYACGHRFRGQI